MVENELHMVPTEDLIEELRRRSNAVLIVTDSDDDGGKGRVLVYAPANPIVAMGLARYATIAVEARGG